MTFRPMRVVLFAGMLHALAVTSQAGEIADLAVKAEQLMEQGKPVAAYEMLDAAVDKLWQRMPFMLRKAIFVVGEPEGFGVYNPRENATFKPGEPIVVYLEFAGFGHKPLSGAYEVLITGDAAIADASGEKILANMKDFLKSRMVSRRRNREFMAHLTITLSGAPAGRYQLLLTLKDEVSGKTAKVNMPFEIRG